MVGILILIGLNFLPEDQMERFRSMGEDRTSELRLMHWENAMDMYQQSLKIFQNTRGEDHPYVAIIYGDMAEVLREQNNVKAAEEMEQKRLSIRSKHKRESKVIAAPEFVGR